MLFRNRIYCTLISLTLTIVAYSQVTYEQFVLEHDQSKLIYFCRKLSTYYLRNSLDTVKMVGSSMLSRNERGDCGWNIGVRYLGSYSLRKGESKNAIRYLNDAQYYFRSRDFRTYQSETENELGNAFNLRGNYNLSAKFYLASIISGGKSSDETASFNGMIGLGKVFCASGDTSSGVRLISVFLSNALRHEKLESSADACAYLGMIYGEQGEVDLMKAYYSRSIRYARECKSRTHIASALNNEAILKFVEGKYDSSLVLFKNALTIREEVGQRKSIVESYYNIAEYYFERGNYKLSEINFLKSHQIAEEYDLLPDQLDALRYLKKLYVVQQDVGKITKTQNEIQRIIVQLDEHRIIDENIFQMATEFEEHAVKEFSPKTDKSMETPIIGGVCLLLLSLLLLKMDRR